MAGRPVRGGAVARLTARPEPRPGRSELTFFTWCVRILLAIGFLPPGWRKVVDEPFTLEESLGDVHTMFTALHQDFGALYVFIGLCQVGAALLLLVPRTAPLGAAVYLPIITGIIVSLDFGPGTPVVTSMMLLGAVYLLCWDWHRVRPLLGPPELPDTGAAVRSCPAPVRRWRRRAR